MAKAVKTNKSRKATKTLRSYQLLHLAATSLRHENHELVVAVKTLTVAVAKLNKRATKAEARLERMAISLRVHRGAHKPRVNKRYVGHKVSAAEKAHLCEIWATNRHDSVKLKAEGRVLAKRYKLHYQRQVLRWFGRFASWTKADITTLVKSRAK